MKPEFPTTIDRKSWLSYLHVKATADERLAAQMEEGERLLMTAAKPGVTWRIMERTDVSTEGFSIQKHLEGCHQVAVMAATLGAEVDRLLRRIQIVDMAMAVVLDSGASVLIEAVCDRLEKQILSYQAATIHDSDNRNDNNGSKDHQDDVVERLYTTPRFSPGYGDYPLKEQRRIIGYLDAQRKIGLSITKDHLMIPRKSITALMGIADHPVTGRLATCGECVLREKCTLRKEGKFCGN